MTLPKMVNKIDEIENEALREFATQKVEEAGALGLVFCEYGYLKSHGGGVHVFKYVWLNPMITDEQRHKIVEFLTADDDSQPSGGYSWFFGDIWHFMPYYC